MSYAIDVTVKSEYLKSEKGEIYIPSLQFKLNSPCIPRESEYIKSDGQRYIVEYVNYVFRDNGYLSEVKIIVRRG